MKVYQVDAFADRIFEGNPAAVLVLQEPADERWMLSVAREMNLSETAFVYRTADGFLLRWFTPAVEVDLCGHATMATAHVLWETGELASDELAVFHTRSGVLTARQADGRILLDFPRDEDVEGTVTPDLADALGVIPRYVGRNSCDILVELDSERAVRDLRPDLGLVARLECRGLIVTSRSDTDDFDFVSRFFAPAAGVPEDPVTGSAHCCLGPYWARKLGRSSCIGRQVSDRGGTVSVDVQGDRVILGGRAVTVMVGELMTEPASVGATAENGG